MTNYQLKEYRPFFTDERWEELQTIINNWVHPTLESGKTLKGVITNPESGLCFVCKDFETESNHMKDHFRKHAFENVLDDDEYDKCSSYTFDTFRADNEKRRFDAAKKIPESEWDGPVFCGDNYYHTTDDFKDMWECDNDLDEDPLPAYVYGSCKEQTFSPKDLDHALDYLLERVGDFENWEPNNPAIPDYLQEAWDRFCKENSETYWEEDRTTVIILNNGN